MNKDVISNKIESLRRCVTRIETVRPPSAEALLENVDAQDILSLNIERAVQISVDIAAHLLAGMETAVPETMAETFRLLHQSGVIGQPLSEKLAKAVGFRNIVVHAYHDIDWAIVYSIATNGPSDFREYVRQVMLHVESQNQETS